MNYIDWNYYDKFENIIDKYMSSQGEGDTKASQLVTAINKLIYKWYNDGDVFDNTCYLQGWENDLTSYANWIRKYIPDAEDILDDVYLAKDENDYELLLKELADEYLNEDFLKTLETEKEGSIYDCQGPYEFEAKYDEEEE